MLIDSISCIKIKEKDNNEHIIDILILFDMLFPEISLNFEVRLIH